jgi:hypothetical protein
MEMDILVAKLEKRVSNPETVRDIKVHGQMQGIGAAVSSDYLSEIENHLGFDLPPLLKEIYTRIGNGGFGPGHGLYDIRKCVELYLISSAKDDFMIGKLPMCNWGCTKDSYVDCLAPGYPVYTDMGDGQDCGCMGNVSFTLTDKNGNVISSGKGSSLSQILNSTGLAGKSANENKNGLILHKKTLDEWFADWVCGINLLDKI